MWRFTHRVFDNKERPEESSCKCFPVCCFIESSSPICLSCWCFVDKAGRRRFQHELGYLDAVPGKVYSMTFAEQRCNFCFRHMPFQVPFLNESVHYLLPCLLTLTISRHDYHGFNDMFCWIYIERKGFLRNTSPSFSISIILSWSTSGFRSSAGTKWSNVTSW